MAWFSLQPSGNPTESDNYNLVTGTPSGCIGTDQICAVQATNNGNDEPILSDALKNEMILALHNRAASTNVQLKNS